MLCIFVNVIGLIQGIERAKGRELYKGVPHRWSAGVQQITRTDGEYLLHAARPITVTGHFGPKTLWHQTMVPKCPGTEVSVKPFITYSDVSSMG